MSLQIQPYVPKPPSDLGFLHQKTQNNLTLLGKIRRSVEIFFSFGYRPVNKDDFSGLFSTSLIGLGDRPESQSDIDRITKKYKELMSQALPFIDGINESTMQSIGRRNMKRCAEITVVALILLIAGFKLVSKKLRTLPPSRQVQFQSNCMAIFATVLTNAFRPTLEFIGLGHKSYPPSPASPGLISFDDVANRIKLEIENDRPRAIDAATNTNLLFQSEAFFQRAFNFSKQLLEPTSKVSSEDELIVKYWNFFKLPEPPIYFGMLPEVRACFKEEELLEALSVEDVEFMISHNISFEHLVKSSKMYKLLEQAFKQAEPSQYAEIIRLQKMKTLGVTLENVLAFKKAERDFQLRIMAFDIQQGRRLLELISPEYKSFLNADCLSKLPELTLPDAIRSLQNAREQLPQLSTHHLDENTFPQIKEAKLQADKQFELLAEVLNKFKTTQIYLDSNDQRELGEYVEYLAERTSQGLNLGFSGNIAKFMRNLRRIVASVHPDKDPSKEAQEKFVNWNKVYQFMQTLLKIRDGSNLDRDAIQKFSNFRMFAEENGFTPPPMLQAEKDAQSDSGIQKWIQEIKEVAIGRDGVAKKTWKLTLGYRRFEFEDLPELDCPDFFTEDLSQTAPSSGPLPPEPTIRFLKVRIPKWRL